MADIGPSLVNTIRRNLSESERPALAELGPNLVSMGRPNGVRFGAEPKTKLADRTKFPQVLLTNATYNVDSSWGCGFSREHRTTGNN